MISGTVLSHLTPTDLWRTFIRFLKMSPRISRVKTYLRTRLFFPDCWPWSRYSCLLPRARSLHTCTDKHLKNLRRKILEMWLVSIWDPTVFPGVRSILRDKIVTDRVRVSECHGTYNNVQARDDSVQQDIIHRVPQALPSSHVQGWTHSATQTKSESEVRSGLLRSLFIRTFSILLLTSCFSSALTQVL